MDNSITENLVVENKNDTIRGYIVKYSNIFYKKIGTELFLNAKTSRTYFKGDIEELLQQNNIEFQNKGGWSCSWTTTYTPRFCDEPEHGYFQEGLSNGCLNNSRSNYTSSSKQTCTYVSIENSLEAEIMLDFSSGGGGGGVSGSSETVSIIPCDGESDGLEQGINGGCFDIVEDELLDDDQIINELTGKDLCIYNKLENLNLYKSTIGKFMENSIYNKNEYNLTIEYGECSTAYIACTSGADIDNKKVKIIIEQGANLGTKPLEFAASLLHEGIHAEIFKYVNEYQKGLDPTKRKELLDWYFEYKSNNEPTLATSTAQHQYMADKFVKPIARAIRTLDNNKYSLEHYMGYGWDGLRRYGFSRYKDNGVEILLTKDLSTEYYKNQAIVNNNTNFNGTYDCN